MPVTPPDWKLVYYYSEMGRCPVLEFLEDLHREQPVESIHFREQIRPQLLQLGPGVGRPIWRALPNGLAEIRWHGRSGQYRIYCSVESGRRIVLYQGRKKDFRTLWFHDERLCLKRKRDFLMDEEDQERRMYRYLKHRQEK
jgi:hypothetical protein